MILQTRVENNMASLRRRSKNPFLARGRTERIVAFSLFFGAALGDSAAG
jgi:hypothetical protein